MKFPDNQSLWLRDMKSYGAWVCCNLLAKYFFAKRFWHSTSEARSSWRSISIYLNSQWKTSKRSRWTPFWETSRRSPARCPANWLPHSFFGRSKKATLEKEWCGSAIWKLSRVRPLVTRFCKIWCLKYRYCKHGKKELFNLNAVCS